MVDPNAHGAAQLPGAKNQRLEGFMDTLQFLLVFLFCVFPDSEHLGIGKIPGIDADFLNILDGG